MDIHLQRIHGLSKDSNEYRQKIDEAVIYQPPASEPLAGPEPDNFIEEAIKEYCHGIQHRKTGKRRTKTTATKHEQAIRLFLPVLNKTTITQLPEIGAEGGVIDTLLDNKEYKTPSLKTYLGFLQCFLNFLASSKEWGKKLDIDANDIVISRTGVKGVSASLRDDQEKELVERALTGEDKLDVTADMIAGYLHGERPKAVAVP